MPPHDSASATDPSRGERALEARATDAAPTRLGRLADVARSWLSDASPADPGATRTLVVETGRGLIARALVERRAPGDLVIAIAGLPADDPAAEGASMDEAFVERRPDAADLDVRAAGDDGADWPLRPDELGTFDHVVLAGGLAWTVDPAAMLTAARDALAPDGRLIVLDDDRSGLTLHPPVPTVESAWRERLVRRAARGAHDGLVRRLPDLLDRCRLEAVAAGTASVDTVQTDPARPEMLTLLAALLADEPPEDPPRLKLADPDPPRDAAEAPGEGERHAAVLRRWSDRPGSVLWWPVPWVVARHMSR